MSAALDDLHAAIWRELVRAAGERGHGWRTPVLATVRQEVATGDATVPAPNARVVILRQADAAARSLTFFTDRRSPKVAELLACPKAMLVFWSDALQWQLRVQCTLALETDGPQVQAAWARISQSAAATDYLSAKVPGSVLAVGEETASSPLTRHQFAIVRASVEAIDWLELAPAAHRRAFYASNTAHWLHP